MKSKLLWLAALLLGSSLLFANNQDCGPGNPTIKADGSVLAADYVSAGYWSVYRAYLSAGHSYAFEVWNPYAAVDQTYSKGRPSVELWDSSGLFCNRGSWTDVAAINPALNSGFSGRISWIQGSDALEFPAIDNLDDTDGYTYNIRLVDTTLFNPRWSTYSGFATQWGFNNNSNSSISGTLTIYDSNGSVLKTKNVSLPAGRVTFYSSGPSDLNLPNNKAGTAMFAYIGPPGAIQADAYFLNASGSVIVPSKFEPRNVQ